MGINVAEMSERTGERESLIETIYLGGTPELMDTKGESFFDVPNNQWMYRPFGRMKFHKVGAMDLDCANDGGWVNGTYTGLKSINTVGKATWSETEDAWIYRPKGLKRNFVIPEKDFVISRDEDVF